MTRAGIQLLIAYALDHDFIQADRRDDEAPDRYAVPDTRFPLTEVRQVRVPNGTLRLGAFPRAPGLTPREGAAGVGRAGVQEQSATDDVQERADTPPHVA